MSVDSTRVANGGLSLQLWRLARAVGLANVGRAVAAHWPFPVRVRLGGGQSMFVDLRSGIGRGLFATGEFDTEAFKPALDRLRPGAVYVDVGANIGVYTVLASRAVSPTGRVVCFEIDGRALSVLRKNVRQLHLSNVTVAACAISNAVGVTQFVPAADHGHNRINHGGAGEKRIRCTTLDAWVESAKLAQLDVLKIDVEGAEKLVLEGASETLDRFKPFIVCEAAERNAAAFGYAAQDLVGILERHGYRVWWVEGAWTPTLAAEPAS